jgi:hypothetical protein
MAELQSSALVPGGTSKVRGTVVSVYYSKVPGTPVSKRLQSTWGDGGVIAFFSLVYPFVRPFGHNNLPPLPGLLSARDVPHRFLL